MENRTSSRSSNKHNSRTSNNVEGLGNQKTTYKDTEITTGKSFAIRSRLASRVPASTLSTLFLHGGRS